MIFSKEGSLHMPTELGYDISLIDLYDLGTAERTGSYILHEEELTVIETSASPSIPHLLKGLEELKIELPNIKNIIVTHIHLDHAGGVGLLLEKCPNARVIVHPRGERHLAEPSKLILGARAVYGTQFDELFDPILPVPRDRLLVKNDGDTLQIGEDRVLTFLDTPGHAKHHFSIHDSKSNGIFTGDTIGVYYPQLIEDGVELYLPSTSPNQFDPDSMLASMERIKKLNVNGIYFGHYGMSTNPSAVFEQINYWLPRFVEVGQRVMEEFPDDSYEEKSVHTSIALLDMVSEFLDERNVGRNKKVYEIINLDLKVCAMGIVDYLSKK